MRSRHLLQKLGLPTTYTNQDFTMNAFDKGDIDLASAMTYNEYGLVINKYTGRARLRRGERQTSST